jgi:hypothetical protein
MTVDKLIADAKRNRTGPITPSSAISPSDLSEFLRFALGNLLEDIDYEGDPASGAALTARVLAIIISNADEATAKAVH